MEPEDDFDAEVLGNFVEGLRMGKVSWRFPSKCLVEHRTTPTCL